MHFIAICKLFNAMGIRKNLICLCRCTALSLKEACIINKGIIMRLKLTIVSLTLLFIQSFASLDAQVNINVKNEPLINVLQQLDRQSGYDILFNSELIKRSGNVTVNIRNFTVENALNSILKGKYLKYEIESKTIIITADKRKRLDTSNDANIQQITFSTIKGTVRDIDGKPLFGVSVVVKQKNKGVYTDKNGNFSIEVESGDLIEFTYVGYESQKIRYQNQNVLDITLKVSDNQLDEIVTIGYGTTRKRDLTGSVAGIGANEIEQSQPRDFMTAMQGRIAGVQIVSESGEPGSGMNIKVRGANSINAGSTPLFVIDGIQLDLNTAEVATSNIGSSATSNPLATINPADIKSIEVLKDASATAIFGSRGANGVVIITTKTGASGKSNLEYNGSLGMSTASKRIDVLSAQDYIAYQRLRNNTSFLMIDTDNDGIPDTDRDFSNYRSHDWQREVLRTAITNDHMLTASGGNARSNYAASAGYLHQQGLAINNDYDRYNFRVRVNHTQSDRLKVGFNLNGAYSEMGGVANNGGIDGYNAMVPLLVVANPWEIRDDDDELISEDYISPLNVIYEGQKNTNLMRIIGNLNGEYKITKNLVFSTNIAANYSNSKLKEFYNSNTHLGYRWQGRAVINEVGTYSYNGNAQLNYNKTFKRHSINAMAGYELSRNNFEMFKNDVTSFEDESTGYNDISKGAILKGYNSERWSTSRMSYMGRLNYNYAGKYLLTGSLRADGSDKFGAGNRWAYFPSAAIAWTISNESFMQPVKAISNLKMRLSYGETGNERITAYSYFARMSNEYYANNNVIMFGMAPSSLENRNLKWETTAQYNAGIDLGLFNERVSITADYYSKITRDMLLDAPVAAQSGFNTQWLNIGRVDNEGFEFALSTKNIQTGNFNWNSNFNISFAKNTVRDLGGAKFIPINIAGDYIGNLGRIVVGQPIGTAYGYVYNGVYQIDEFTWQNNSDPAIPHASRTYTLKSEGLRYSGGNPQPGMLKYKDISGPDGVPDGVVDDAYDRAVISNSNPKHTGGFNNSFQYKNFDLSILFQWSYGNDILNVGKLRVNGYTPFMNVTYDYYNNFWSENNPTNQYAAPGKLDNTNSSYYVEDGSYLRLKSVYLSYRLPSSILKGTGFSEVKFYLAGQNLLTWTKYSGFDPEVNSNNPLLGGYERFSYPRPRNFSFGVNVKF